MDAFSRARRERRADDNGFFGNETDDGVARDGGVDLIEFFKIKK